MKKIIIAALALVAAAACGKADLPLENTKWELVELNGEQNAAFGENADSFWFSLDGKQIFGTGACNRFFGGYDLSVMGQILKLGLTPFLIIAVDNVMIITMNALLQKYGGANGDALINCNTIVQSFMLVLTMPLGGISGGTQGIISYNYGACNTERVLKAQKYIFGLCIGYTALLLIAAQIAGGVYFFATDASGNATGSSLVMDGGMDSIVAGGY